MAELRTAWEGRAGQVRVGHFIQGRRQTLDDIWEVTETRHPSQIEYGRTLWWKVANITSGLEATIPPKVVTARVRFMLTPTEHAEAIERKRPPDMPRQWPVDSDEMMLLVETLGAREIATRDNHTGEVTCPNYTLEPWTAGVGPADELQHLRIAHGLDISGLEAMTDWEAQMHAIIATHGPLHGPSSSGLAHRGFPHRHIPEDTSFIR